MNTEKLVELRKVYIEVRFVVKSSILVMMQFPS